MGLERWSIWILFILFYLFADIRLMTQIRCAFPTHSNHPLSRPSRYASLANELEGYKYTIKYDDGDAEEFSEKGGGKYIKTIQQFKNAIIVAYVSNDGNISDLHDRNCKRYKPSKKPSDHYCGPLDDDCY